MTRRVEILRTDWERLRRAYPEMDPDQLAKELLVRGQRRVAGQAQESIPPTAALEERLAWLRGWTPRLAASLATLGFELVRNRTRLDKATEREELTYQRDLELKKEVVPELKERAKALRQEMFRLEAELRSRGGDPDAIEPRLPVGLMSVDEHQRPQYETNESRRKTTLEFFRRLDRYKK
jgi:uncharacterized small protein (DUF1192 family)/ribosome modulation factor